MRLRHIEVFRAVMLTGSASAAARLLSVSQPVVSRVLQHAELGLGFALFERARGRLLPTAEARALFAQVQRAWGEIERVEALAANLRRGAALPIHIQYRWRARPPSICSSNCGRARPRPTCPFVSSTSTRPPWPRRGNGLGRDQPWPIYPTA